MKFSEVIDRASDLLAPVYNWFTEGFDTADLQDAKALPDSLSLSPLLVYLLLLLTCGSTNGMPFLAVQRMVGISEGVSRRSMAGKQASHARTPRIADRLRAAREKRFVGREDEIALFRSALQVDAPPFAVLYIYGPGGVGKTTLLEELAHFAVELNRPVVQIDSRNLESSPPGFLSALCHALNLTNNALPALLANWPATGILFIDTYEMLTPLDAWLRETFLPQLPAHSLVVIAGRTPPATEWFADIAWADLTHVISLRNLRPEESLSYLAARNIPDQHTAAVLTFTHGHPLALSLVADVLAQAKPSSIFDPNKEPHILRALVERFVQDAPSPAHRLALDICAIARATTESLLAKLIDGADPFVLFVWLRDLSFIEQGPYGLFPHDVVREVLEADLRWRHPERYRQLKLQIFTELSSQFHSASGQEQRVIRRDILYMRRNTPYNKPYLDWNALDDVYAEPASPQDGEEILQMVRAHEGEKSARIARHWWRRQPEAFLLFRNFHGDLFGFMATLTGLQQAIAEDRAIDPAVAAALQFVQRYGPLRPGEEIVHLRFWMQKETYQAVSPAITLTAINTTIAWLTTPRLAWSFTTMAHPDFMEPHFRGLGIQRAPEADFVVDGRRYGVFAHDWRTESPIAWQERMTRQALTINSPTEPAAKAAVPPPFLVLSQTAFSEAVRQALRDYTRPDVMAENPLLHTRLVVETADSPASLTTLQALLQEAAATLRLNPKDEKLYRVLKRTYFEPAPTQEQAADLLDLPFSTYRYRLAKGIERITAWLWQKEISGSSR